MNILTIKIKAYYGTVHSNTLYNLFTTLKYGIYQIAFLGTFLVTMVLQLYCFGTMVQLARLVRGEEKAIIILQKLDNTN